MRTPLRGLSLAVLGLFVAAPALSQAPVSVSEAVLSELNVEIYELQRIEMPALLDSNFVTRIELEGQPFTLVAHHRSLRSDSFQVLVEGADGVLRPKAVPEPVTFRGELLEMPGSVVAASVIAGQLHASITSGADFHFGIQPLSIAVEGADPDVYVVYDAADATWQDVECGTPDELMTEVGSDTWSVGTGFTLCEIAFDADVQFYNDNGGNLTNTINDIENVMNGVTAIYESDVSVTFQITTMIVRTSGQGIYTTTDAGGLLDQFRNEWTQNQSFIKRDVAHLMTGKNLNGGTIGVAWVSAICSSLGFGLSERYTSNLTNRIGLTAHEVGHNYGASHCNGSNPCYIMCSGLGGCSNNVTLFAPTSIGAITSFSSGIFCTPDLASPLTVPFTAGFNFSVIANSNWTTNQGGTSSTAGLGEPSGDRALNLDAFGPQTNADDFIRSNFILLAGESNLSLSYFTEHRGVEAGEALVVEYMNAAENWVELNRVTSNGIDQGAFVFHQHALPPGAYHDGFRMQFRTEGDEADDDWFVDDILLDVGSQCPQPSAYCLTAPNSIGAGAAIGSFGTTGVSANDFGLSASAMPAGQFGVFYYGPEQIQLTFGEGWRCVGGGGIGTFRLNAVIIDPLGGVVFPLDITNPPSPAGQIQVGQTWNFQFWYRDPAGGPAGFNLTDALEATFCP